MKMIKMKKEKENRKEKKRKKVPRKKVQGRKKKEVKVKEKMPKKLRTRRKMKVLGRSNQQEERLRPLSLIISEIILLKPGLSLSPTKWLSSRYYMN